MAQLYGARSKVQCVDGPRLVLRARPTKGGRKLAFSASFPGIKGERVLQVWPRQEQKKGETKEYFKAIKQLKDEQF
jgi:hypothetical protein